MVDSREVEDNKATRRRRECEKCENRFTTYERIELGNLMVIKKDSTRELYDRQKIVHGVLQSLQRRPVSQDQVKEMMDGIEEKWRHKGINEIKSRDIGEAVMNGLKKLDQVAYIRFASVYREFKDVGEFKKEIGKLKKKYK